MGLITKEVEVTLTNNIKYYENLGYKIPRRRDKYGRMKTPQGTKIMVKVFDLPFYSKEQIKFECDCCKNLITTIYESYSKYNHNGIMYCNKCASSIFNSGEKHYNYNHNKTDEERQIGRNYTEYAEFIKRVLKRDNHTCQCCGQHGGKLEVHHLDGYDWCVEKRTDDTNGITLCSNCHSNFHSQYGYKNSIKKEFEEWFGKTIELVKCGIAIQPCRQVYCIETDNIYDSVKQLCSELNISDLSTVYNICNRKYNSKNKSYKGYHFIWYDEYITMSKDEIVDYVEKMNVDRRYRSVICLETLEVFDTISSAVKKYKTKDTKTNLSTQIISACKNINYSAFSYHWMYYEDFLKLPQEEQNKILSKNKDSSKGESFII